MTSSSVFVRDAACGNAISVANEGQCFSYAGERTTCTLNGQLYDFFRVDFNGRVGWLAGTFVEIGLTRRCENELRAIILGDWGEIKLQGQGQVAAGMAVWAETNDPAWIITTGDNIYPRGFFSWDDPQVDIKWRNVYNQESLRNLSWYISVGNHDYGENGGNEWNQVELAKHEPRWILPHLWYDFIERMADHSVHFVVIDTEAFGGQVNDYEVMLEWFEKTLRESTADWLFVVGHRHAFSVGDVFSDDDIGDTFGPITGHIVEVLVPVMVTYGVDAYICGHDHNLQHIQNLTDPSSMDYIISGAGGALPSRYIADNEDIIREAYNVAPAFFKLTYGFVTLTTHRDSARFDFFDQDANLVYSYARPQQRSPN